MYVSRSRRAHTVAAIYDDHDDTFDIPPQRTGSKSAAGGFIQTPKIESAKTSGKSAPTSGKSAPTSGKSAPRLKQVDLNFTPSTGKTVGSKLEVDVRLPESKLDVGAQPSFRVSVSDARKSSVQGNDSRAKMESSSFKAVAFESEKELRYVNHALNSDE